MKKKKICPKSSLCDDAPKGQAGMCIARAERRAALLYKKQSNPYLNNK